MILHHSCRSRAPIKLVLDKKGKKGGRGGGSRHSTFEERSDPVDSCVSKERMGRGSVSRDKRPFRPTVAKSSKGVDGQQVNFKFHSYRFSTYEGRRQVRDEYPLSEI